MEIDTSIVDPMNGSVVRGRLVAGSGGATVELVCSRDGVGTKELAVDTTAGFDASMVDPMSGSDVIRGRLVAGSGGATVTVELVSSRDGVGTKELAVDTTAGFDASMVDSMSGSDVIRGRLVAGSGGATVTVELVSSRDGVGTKELAVDTTAGFDASMVDSMSGSDVIRGRLVAGSGGATVTVELVSSRDGVGTKELAADTTAGFDAVDLVSGSDAIRGRLVAGSDCATGELVSSRDGVGTKELAVDTTAGFDASTVDPVNGCVEECAGSGRREDC